MAPAERQVQVVERSFEIKAGEGPVAAPRQDSFVEFG